MPQPRLEQPNLNALAPLFDPWDIPDHHREKAEQAGGSALVAQGRRPTPIAIAQNLRRAVGEWRENGYPNASDTTQSLFRHWFERNHLLSLPDGGEREFHYFFCQREAIETFVYLRELRGITRLSRLMDEFGGPGARDAALGVTEGEDRMPRYAFKIATGAGKTKVMSLAIVWSYFHALRESDSPMAKAFVIIAPNLTVYERLKEDFGDGGIFEADPLIPPEWKGDFSMSVVLQDGAGGGSGSSGGVIYLTNIHRLYDPERRNSANGEHYSFMGPSVSRANALDQGESLRKRISSHDRIMVLNDEAHHVWDPDSAWNEAIDFLHEGCSAVRDRGSDDDLPSAHGVIAELDFSATPKDNQGNLFKHIVCDTPLGEAVDAGIVKTPVIGSSVTRLQESPAESAAYRYEQHLMLGYECWKRSREEWEKSGKKPLLFVMCEDTKAADEIAARLNSDSAFSLLNGKTINLHTNLKGKVKKIGSGEGARLEFVENEKAISEDDLRKLRELSRDLDSGKSPYVCIVSVLMLREGWDVRNVTTIVPLRAFSSQARILPEQTLGRGLRRMSVPGCAGAHEIVTVVEHPAFAHLYDEELAQEGLFLEVAEAASIPRNTVSIFPDPDKDSSSLDIDIPRLSAGYSTVPTLPACGFDEVKDFFSRARLAPLPLGSSASRELEYEGKTLMTDELVERFKMSLPLTTSLIGAVSYYRIQIEALCRVSGTHRVLAPLIERFLTETLFGQLLEPGDKRLVGRLGDADVAEHIRAVFVPLVRSKIVSQQRRGGGAGSLPLSSWRPFQATQNERHPAIPASRTLFNLVPCDRKLEEAFARFLDSALDVAAFAKNAGPEALKIDYLSCAGTISLYTPDFIVRDSAGACYLVETKGEVDQDVHRKAAAAKEWCGATKAGWEYVYVTQELFRNIRGSSFRELARAAAPSLTALLQKPQIEQLPLFATAASYGAGEEETGEEGAILAAEGFASNAELTALPERYQRAVEQSVELFRFIENKENMNFAPALNALLGIVDDAATHYLKKRLGSYVPFSQDEQKAFFNVRVPREIRDADSYESMAKNLRRTLVFDNGLSPIGLLRSSLDYALNGEDSLGGIFSALKTALRREDAEALYEAVAEVNNFRNRYVAHQQEELRDRATAKAALKHWVRAIVMLTDPPRPSSCPRRS